MTFAAKQGGTTFSTTSTVTLITVGTPTVAITSPTANQGGTTFSTTSTVTLITVGTPTVAITSPTANQGGTTFSTTSTVTLITVGTPTVAITSPTANQGLSASDLDSDGKATVTGTVDDGGILAVTSGGTLSNPESTEGHRWTA